MNILNALGVVLLLLSGASVLYALLLAIFALTPPRRRFLLRLFLHHPLRKAKKVGTASRRIRFFLSLLRLPRKITRPFVPRNRSGREEEVARAFSRLGFYGNTMFALLALGVLTWNLIAANFSNLYVASYISEDLPLLYRFTALWAGPAGSFLLWYLFLAFFSALIVHRAERLRFRGQASLYLLLGLMNVFFILLLLLQTDVQPFRVFPAPRAAGNGLNPLLQHWAMILHPPLLLAGYAGSAISFALALIELTRRHNEKNDWCEIRRWVLLAWYLLGGGILLGAVWAYDELGWGGYWAWDPVENGGLLPFLALTAYLHSRQAQERRGHFRTWNVFLLALAFLLCILAAWITRSGFLQGLHTFTGSNIGPYFILFLLLFSMLTLRALQIFRPAQSTVALSYRLFSREGGVLLANYLTLLIILVLLLGIFSPVLPFDCSINGGAISCHKAEWKPAAFNRALTVPGLLFLLLTGLGPLLFWRRNSLEGFIRRLRGPLFTGIAGGILFVLLVKGVLRQPLIPSPDFLSALRALLITIIVFFISGGAVQEIVRAIRAEIIRHPEGGPLTILRLFQRERRRLGGVLLHFSVALLFLSFAGGAFEADRRIEFHYIRTPADPYSTRIVYRTLDRVFFAGYEIEAGEFAIAPRHGGRSDRSNPAHLAVAHEARFMIRKPDGSEEGIKTANVFYPRVDQQSGLPGRDKLNRIVRRKIGEPGIMESWTADLHLQLNNVRRPDRPQIPEINHPFEFYYFRPGNRRLAHDTLFPPALIVVLEVKRNPLARFFRLGTLLFFILGFFQLLPGEKKESPFRFEITGH